MLCAQPRGANVRYNSPVPFFIGKGKLLGYFRDLTKDQK